MDFRFLIHKKMGPYLLTYPLLLPAITHWFHTPYKANHILVVVEVEEKGIERWYCAIYMHTHISLNWLLYLLLYISQISSYPFPCTHAEVDMYICMCICVYMYMSIYMYVYMIDIFYKIYNFRILWHVVCLSLRIEIHEFFYSVL